MAKQSDWGRGTIWRVVVGESVGHSKDFVFIRTEMGRHWSILSRWMKWSDMSFSRSWSFWNEAPLTFTSGVRWVSLKPAPSPRAFKTELYYSSCSWMSLECHFLFIPHNDSPLFDLTSVGPHFSNWNKPQGQPFFFSLHGCRSWRAGKGCSRRTWAVLHLSSGGERTCHSSGGKERMPQLRR